MWTSPKNPALSLTLACTPLLIAGAATLAFAQTASEARCRTQLGKDVGRYIERAMKEVAACHRNCAKGKRTVGCDQCNDPIVADEGSGMAVAAQKVIDSIGGENDRCSDDSGVALSAVLAQYPRCPSPAAEVDNGGTSNAIDDFPELATCLLALSNRTLAGLGDTLFGRAARSPAFASDVRRCHTTITRGVSKTVRTLIRETARCQRSEDKQGGALDFGCWGRDDRGKIASTSLKLAAKLTKRCGALDPNFATGVGSLPDPCDPDPCGALRCVGSGNRYYCYDYETAAALDDVGSCADNVDLLTRCILGDPDDPGVGTHVLGFEPTVDSLPSGIAISAARGLSAMLYELPSTCPTRALMAINAGHGLSITATRTDAGWTGYGHDGDLPDRTTLALDLDCDSDCDNCTATINPAAGNCRCDGDMASRCDEPFVADTDDCGGAMCRCYLAPPNPSHGGGFPICVMLEIDTPVVGTLHAGSGAIELPLNIRSHMALGGNPFEPCPSCDPIASTCSGGERDGLVCAPTAQRTFAGASSLDCPPSETAIISGNGTLFGLPLSSDIPELHADLPCGLIPTVNCHCGVCSLDTTIACSADADCAALAAGTCTGAAGASTLLNSCIGECRTDGSCDESSPALSQSCDGFIEPGGRGLLNCSTNDDCTVLGPQAGNCTVQNEQYCFGNTIVAPAYASPSSGIASSVSCRPPAESNIINSTIGLPGPSRYSFEYDLLLACPDGRRFEPPGGTSCAQP